MPSPRLCPRCGRRGLEPSQLLCSSCRAQQSADPLRRLILRLVVPAAAGFVTSLVLVRNLLLVLPGATWNSSGVALTLVLSAGLAAAAVAVFLRLPAALLPAALRLTLSLWIVSTLLLGVGTWVDLQSPTTGLLHPLWILALLPSGGAFLHLLITALTR